MKPVLKFNQTPYADLASGIVALASSVVVFIFFIDISTKHVTIKPEYSSLVWGIFSVTSIIYYFIGSKGNATSGGYINPLFNGFLKVMRIIPLIGLIFSLIGGTKFIIESQTWNTIVNTSSNFLNSIIILFLVANFGAGVDGVRNFFKER